MSNMQNHTRLLTEQQQQAEGLYRDYGELIELRRHVGKVRGKARLNSKQHELMSRMMNDLLDIAIEQHELMSGIMWELLDIVASATDKEQGIRNRV